MSVLLECNGVEAWNPSNVPGHIFIDQVASLGTWLGQTSGIEETMEDTFEIDAATFALFIQRALGELEQTNHRALFAMASGCVEVAIALNARITGAWPPTGEQTGVLVRRAQTIMQQPLWYFQGDQRVRCAPPE